MEDPAMQTTRPVTSEALERRTVPASAEGSSRPRRRSYGRLVFFFLAVSSIVAASIIGTGWVHLGEHATKTPEDGPPPLSEAGYASGFVDVETRLINLFPTQPGKIVELPVHEDQAVLKDALLLRVDDRLAKLRVKEAEADVKAAEAQLAQAEEAPAQFKKGLEEQEAAIEVMKRDKARAEALFHEADRLFKSESQLISKEKRDAAHETVKKAEAGIKAEEAKLARLRLKEPSLKLDIERARADVAAKSSRLDQAKLAVDECKLKAPCDGKVLRLLVSVGDLMGPAPREPAIIFCPAGDRIIRAEIEQEFASRVHVGQSAVIQDDARLSGEWHGEVKRISDWYLPKRNTLFEPKQFNDVRTMECIIKVKDGKDLRIGQRVRVILGK
jgi:HlyD family secretion protein